MKRKCKQMAAVEFLLGKKKDGNLNLNMFEPLEEFLLVLSRNEHFFERKTPYRKHLQYIPNDKVHG